VDRTPRPSDRCQRIIDLIDACLAEHAMPVRPVEPVASRRPRRS
jgi:hypothetical protein